MKKLTIIAAILILVSAGLVVVNDSSEGEVFRQLPMVSDPWSGDISYYDNTDYNKTLDLAIKRWHDTGLPIKFKEVESRGDADIIIEDDPDLLKENCNDSECMGNAPIGNSLIGRKTIYLHPLLETDNNIIDTKMLAVTIHELGHVLGLDHNSNKCSIMNQDSDCQERQLELDISENGATFACGPFKSDLEELGELYNFTPTSNFSSTCFDPVANSQYYQDIQEQLASADTRDSYLKNFSK